MAYSGMRAMERSIEKDKKILEVRKKMAAILKPMRNEKRKRVIKAVAALYGVI